MVEAVDVGKAVVCRNGFPLHAVGIAVRRAASSRNIVGVDIGVGYAVKVSFNYGVPVNKIGFAVKIGNIECPFRGVGVEINGSQPRGDPFDFHFNRGESSIKVVFLFGVLLLESLISRLWLLIITAQPALASEMLP
jgi:hypothetical protein